MIEHLTGKELRRILEENGFSFSKSLGQNFLCDERILNKIADDAQIPSGQTVLEIGTGAGTLTRILAKRAKRVVTVEIDKRLLSVHEQTLAGFDNITVVPADFLALDFPSFFEENLADGFAVCANLPYYITTPILMRILESGLPFSSVTVLVQKEVAERMAARANTPEYGALTVAVQYYCAAHLCSTVPPSCFYPAPKVASRVIRLDRRPHPAVTVRDERLFFSCVRACFAMRRKTLANNLIASFALSRKDAEEILQACSLAPTVRGEALDARNIARVADELAIRGIRSPQIHHKEDF